MGGDCKTLLKRLSSSNFMVFCREIDVVDGKVSVVIAWGKVHGASVVKKRKLDSLGDTVPCGRCQFKTKGNGRKPPG